MYWFRDASVLSFIPWLVSALAFWAGGWLLATHLFEFKKNERLMLGLGIGLISQMWLLNILGRFLPEMGAFILAPVLVLVAGVLLAWRSNTVWLSLDDLRAWPWVVAFLVFTYLFLRFGQGLAIFDEFKNLSLISVMAAGDIPPHYSAELGIYFRYHYGFHLLPASMMRLGGMLPWSAFDLAKAVVWGYTLILAGILGARQKYGRWAAWLVPAILAVASGTRYLLLLLPRGFFLRADDHITLAGTSAYIDLPFSQALLNPWPIDGGPPFPYPFAFINGLFQPLVMSHQGPNTSSVLILLLLILLIPKVKHGAGYALMTILFSMWALIWEASYGAFVIGAFATYLLFRLFDREVFNREYRLAMWAIVASVPVVVLQGGWISEIIWDVIRKFTSFGSHVPITEFFLIPVFLIAPWFLNAPGFLDFNVFGFGLRWPPAIVSSHFEPLSIFDPYQFIVGLFEIGPILLFAIPLSVWVWRDRRKSEWGWVAASMMISSWAAFIAPFFLTFSSDRDITRLTWYALLTWTLFLLVYLFNQFRNWRGWLRGAVIASLSTMCFGGLVVLGIQFTALSTTQLAHGFDQLDSELQVQVWDQLPDSARIYGDPGRIAILTGRLAYSIGDYRPEYWAELDNELSLAGLLENGFQYLLLTNRWPADLATQDYEQFDTACVKLVAESHDNSGVNYRKLYDLRGCTP